MAWNQACVIIIATLCLTALAVTALANGIDGAALASISALIGGGAGFSASKIKKTQKEVSRHDGT